jgi:hypothetical protein
MDLYLYPLPLVSGAVRCIPYRKKFSDALPWEREVAMAYLLMLSQTGGHLTIAFTFTFVTGVTTYGD